MNKAPQSTWRRREAVRKKRQQALALLPSILTLGNGTCGLAAIAIAVSETLPWADEQKLMVAGLFIFAGMLFDAFDGQAARMTNQSSEFGAQLDSMCDVITFGTAPAVILWRYSDVLPHRFSWTIGVLFALCVVLRLARFNVQTASGDSHETFVGLPSPAAAGTIASIMISVPQLSQYDSPSYPETVQIIAARVLEATHYLVPGLAVILASLMVSRFRYPHVLQQFLGGRRSIQQIRRIVFLAVIAFLLHELVLPLGLLYFAFASPIRQLLARPAGRGLSPLEGNPPPALQCELPARVAGDFAIGESPEHGKTASSD